MRPSIRLCAVLLATVTFWLVASCRGAPLASSLPVAPTAEPSPPCLADHEGIFEVLQASGMEPPSEVARFELGMGERHSVPIEVPPNRCALISILGGCGINALSLRIIEDGSLRSLDSMARNHAHGILCAEQQIVTAVAWIEVLEGRGEISLTTSDVSDSTQETLASPSLPSLSLPASVEEAAATVNTAMTSQGFEAGQELLATQMTEGDAATVDVSLPANTCASLRAVGAPSVSDIDIEAVDKDGRLLAADRRTMPLPAVGLCSGSDAPRSFRVRVICMRGKGEVRLLSHMIKANAGVQGGRVEDLSEVLLRRKLETVGMTDEAPASRLARTKHGLWTTQAVLTGGRCYGMALLSDSSLNDVEVRADSGLAIASWKGPGGQAILTMCPDAGANVTIAASGPGNIAPRLLWLSTKTPH